LLRKQVREKIFVIVIDYCSRGQYYLARRMI
jgi:hypothetical protein